jgi:hypothetical protein
MLSHHATLLAAVSLALLLHFLVQHKPMQCQLTAYTLVPYVVVWLGMVDLFIASQMFLRSIVSQVGPPCRPAT